MTDLEERTPMHALDAMNALYEESKEIVTIQNAAQKCAANYNYYGARKPVYLLDFSIVYGALRTLNIVTIFDGAETSEHPPQTSLAPLLGPHTLRNILREPESFTLPPGAQYELLRQKEKMEVKLSGHARQLMGKLNSALDSRDPARTMATNVMWGDLRRTLAQEFTGFDMVFDDLRVLQDLIDRCEPAETLVGDKPHQSDPAFASALRFLETRPRRVQLPRNNAADALNVAFLAWLFYSPNKSLEHELVPIMVSNAPSMLTLEGMKGDLLQMKDPGPMTLFGDPYYFRIAWALSRSVDRRNELVSVSASVLARHAGELQAKIVDVRNAVSSNAIDVSDKSAPEWVMLDIARQQFVAEWGDLLNPLSRYEGTDGTTYRNALYTLDVRALAEQIGRHQSVEETRGRLRAIRDKMLDASRQDRQLWRYLSAPSELTPLSFEREEPTAELFNVSVITDGLASRRLIVETKPTKPIDIADLRNIPRGQALRVVLSPRYVGWGDVALVVDSWWRGACQWLGIVWRHENDVGSLPRVLADTAKALGFERSRTAWLKFGRRVSGGVARTAEEPPSPEELADADYVELSCGEATLFADVAPLASAELQLGLMGPADGFDRSVLAGLAALAEATSPLPYQSDSYANVLGQIVGGLRQEHADDRHAALPPGDGSGRKEGSPLPLLSAEAQQWQTDALAAKALFGHADCGHGLTLLSAVFPSEDRRPTEVLLHDGVLRLKLVNRTRRRPPAVKVNVAATSGLVAWLDEGLREATAVEMIVDGVQSGSSLASESESWRDFDVMIDGREVIGAIASINGVELATRPAQSRVAVGEGAAYLVISLPDPGPARTCLSVGKAVPVSVDLSAVPNHVASSQQRDRPRFEVPEGVVVIVRGEGLDVSPASRSGTQGPFDFTMVPRRTGELVLTTYLLMRGEVIAEGAVTLMAAHLSNAREINSGEESLA